MRGFFPQGFWCQPAGNGTKGRVLHNFTAVVLRVDRSSNDDATMQENVKCAAFTNCALK